MKRACTYYLLGLTHIGRRGDRDDVGAEPVLPEHEGRLLPHDLGQPGPHPRRHRLHHRAPVARPCLRLVRYKLSRPRAKPISIEIGSYVET